MKSMRPFLVALLAMILTVPAFSQAQAELAPVPVPGDYVPNQILVGYRNQGNEMASTREQVRKDVAAKSFSKISPLSNDVELVELGQGVSVGQALARLRGKSGIRFVEPNFIYKTMQTSNDPRFLDSSLWGMYGSATSPANTFGSNAANAWSRGYTGSQQVVIGVIDTGIEIAHPDLRENIWTNPSETASNGIDDDRNGYIDDVSGWDFLGNNSSVYDGTDDNHGTHVAGTIGARGGNSTGVVGVNWNVKMISAKFLAPTGGYLSDAIRAVDYFTALKLKGVNIVATSNSWGGGGFSQGLLDAINRGGNAGILFIAAAGNDSTNNDLTASYPSSYRCTTSVRSWDCMISVASITSTGAISSFSNFGATSVDLGAPGSAILSTLPGGTYGSYSGTSMATPHVSGAAALCASINPTITPSAIRLAIMQSVVATGSLAGKTATGGRLDVGAMATLCAPVSSKLNQSSLSISNSLTTGLNPTSAVTLTTVGGTGDGAVTFATTSPGCAISGDSLTVTTPVNCSVTATKAGDATYNPVTSPIKVFNFVGDQLALRLSPLTGIYAKGTTGITLTTTGGSGSGGVTYRLTSTNTSCRLVSNKLSVDKRVRGDVICTVIATKAASTNFKLVESAAVSYTFR